MSNSELSIRATVTQLVAAFQTAEAVVRRCYAELTTAEERLNIAFSIGDVAHSKISIEASSRGYGTTFNAEDAVECMARDAWSSIVDRLELRRMMSVERYAALEKELEKGKLPAITEANVFAFADQYRRALPDMMREAVVEVFEWLRPRAHTVIGKLKSNTELEVGRKAILGYMIERAGRHWTWKPNVNYHYRQNLIALENVFNALDGKGQIGKEHYSVLQRAIEASGENGGKGETDLFKFKVFQNGNMHLEFKRLDLLKRFNAIAGGNRIRPAAPVDVDHGEALVAVG